MKEQCGRKERCSNIELLRIIAILGVIILHYNNPSIGGAFKYAGGINRVVLYLLESMCVCAVNLFILISGYFMCQTQQRILYKPLQLLTQVMLFSFTIYILQVIFKNNRIFSLKEMFNSLIPDNYFVILYVALYFLSPLVNAAVLALSRKQMRNMAIILLLLFSVWPTIVDFSGELIGREWIGLSTIGMYGSQWGYTIVNFALMYFIGAVIYKNETKISDMISKKKVIFLYALCIVLLTGWAFLDDHIGYGTERSAWEYCNPFVVLMAILLFIVFKQIRMQNIKWINELAKGAFTVFLLHTLFIPHLQIVKFVSGNLWTMLMHVVVSSIGIYLICWCIFRIYDYITTPIYRKIGNMFPLLTKDLME